MVCSEIPHVPCNTTERFVYPNAAADQGSSPVSSQQGWQIYYWQCDQSHWWQRLSRAGRGHGSLHVLLHDTHKSQNACIVIKAVCWTFLFFSCARLHPRRLGKHVVLIKCFSIAQQRFPNWWRSAVTKRGCQITPGWHSQNAGRLGASSPIIVLCIGSLGDVICSPLFWDVAFVSLCFGVQHGNGQMLAAPGESRGCRRSFRAWLCNRGMSAWFLEENRVWSFKDTWLSFILMWNIWLLFETEDNDSSQKRRTLMVAVISGGK